MRFSTWLSTQRDAETAQGIDHHHLACYPVELTDHVRTHLHNTCRSLERAELVMPANDDLDDKQRATWEESREEFVRQIVGALESLGYVLNAVGCSDRELHTLYITNPLHMPTGDADAGVVCAECKTSVDRSAARVIVLPDGVTVCGKNCADTYNQTATSSVDAPDLAPETRTAEK